VQLVIIEETKALTGAEGKENGPDHLGVFVTH